MAEDKKIIIIGAGLVGALLGVTLASKGHKVVIYERYVDIRSIPSLGRSINLVLTSRGLRAIAAVSRELAERMIKLSVKVTGRGVHVDGKEAMQRYGKDDSEFNYSISRFELNVFLIDAAEKAGVQIHFNHRVESVDFDKDTIRMIGGESKSLPQMIGGGFGEKKAALVAASEVLELKFDHLIGADGAGSAVRHAMRDAGLTQFYEEYINSGYKEIIFPKEPAKGREGMNPNLLHIWPNHEHFLMTLADRPKKGETKGTFTGTFYMPHTGEESFASLKTEAQVGDLFQKYYSDCFPLMGEGGKAEMVRQFMANPVGKLGQARCHKFNAGGKALLIGDAAHAMVPFFGQGTNCGFEDVLDLSRIIDANGNQLNEKVFEAFDFRRRPNTWAIQNMAFENFNEMQSRVADPAFLLAKGVETVLELACPELYRSRYAMVCYGGLGNVTYSAAYRLGKLQEEIRKDLCVGLSAPEDLDIEKAKNVLRERLLPVQKKMKIDLMTVNHEFWNVDEAHKAKL